MSCRSGQQFWQLVAQAHSTLEIKQGNLTEVEGSVQLTSSIIIVLLKKKIVSLSFKNS
jgi:hypothetical protein